MAGKAVLPVVLLLLLLLLERMEDVTIRYVRSGAQLAYQYIQFCNSTYK
jgi:hypothetical protein